MKKEKSKKIYTCVCIHIYIYIYIYIHTYDKYTHVPVYRGERTNYIHEVDYGKGWV